MFIKISENTCVTSEKTVIIKANNFYDKYSNWRPSASIHSRQRDTTL